MKKKLRRIQMKLMIASDLHGSAYYTENMMKAWERENPGRLLLLGDLLYHGPRSRSLPGFSLSLASIIFSV